MRTFTTTLILASLASAFDVVQYNTKRCTSSRVWEEGVTSSKGCVKARPDGAPGVIAVWAEEDDNDTVLALYSDDSCCHANFVAYVGWEDGCTATDENVGSFRAVNPNDSDEGGDYESCEAELNDTEMEEVEGVPPPWDV